MASKSNIYIDQGADFSTTVTVTDDDDAIVDLTGYTASAKMRKYFTSSNSFAFTTNIHSTNGQVVLTMNSSTTGNISSGRYVYDAEVADANNFVIRIIEGIVTVRPQATR